MSPHSSPLSGGFHYKIMKKCSKCKQIKEFTEFYKNKKTKDGLYPNCKKCHSECMRKWQREKGRYKYNKYHRERKIKNPKFRLDSNMASFICQCLKGKKAGMKWEKLVGYTLEDLIKHLENRFESWMSWDNYGKWHIDHIKPKSLFNINEFKECWALDNLQPLEAHENRVKYNNYQE